MANREKGEVSLIVGGASYTLVLSFNGMIEAEDASETSVGQRLTWDEIGAAVMKGELRHLRLFMWALLRKHHPALTPVDVGELIDAAGGIDALRQTLEDAVRAADPDPEDTKALAGGKNHRPRKARTDGAGVISVSPPAGSA